MKRTMTVVCTTLVTGMMMITPAFAANTSTGHTDISLFVPNDPIYTVTVPEKVTLSATEHTQVPVTAIDVQYIPEGKKISVILKKGNGVYGRLYLTGDKNNGNKPYLMTIMIKGTGDEFKMGALEKQIKGMELASFTDNGTVNYEMYPVSQDYPEEQGKVDSNLAIQKGVHYTGWIDYGIGVYDIK